MKHFDHITPTLKSLYWLPYTSCVIMTLKLVVLQDLLPQLGQSLRMLANVGFNNQFREFHKLFEDAFILCGLFCDIFCSGLILN